MGIWEFIGSTTEAVKRNAPDVTPVKRACRSSYDYGSAAFTKIDHAVRIYSFHGLTQWMPDKQNIGIYASKFAKNVGYYALHEGYKFIPGGVVVAKILTNTLNDVKHENLKVEKLKASEEKMATPKKFSSDGRKLIDGAEMHSGEGGMQVYTIVREKLQGEPTSQHSKGNKKQDFVVVEEMQLKLEKMKKDENKIKQQNKVSTHRTKEQEDLKQFSDEPMKSSKPEVMDRKKIFIRSRL